MNLVSSRLAARAHTRQVELTLHADRAADVAERAVQAVWREFLAMLRNGGGSDRQTYVLFANLLPSIKTALNGHLGKIALWSYRRAARDVAAVTPLPYLRAAAALRVKRDLVRSSLGASQRHPARIGSLPSLQLANENRGSAAAIFGFGGNNLAERLRLLAEEKGLIQFGELGATLPPPTIDGDYSHLFSLLFPPPSELDAVTWLGTTLQGTTWWQALDAAARNAEFGPGRLAQDLAGGYALGETQRDLAKRALPYVDGVRYRARRVARTWGMAIGQAAIEQAHRCVDDLTIGFQVHATLDQNTRPAHRARNGTIYYKAPKSGQPGLDQMPHPPREADGELAWNCRCTTSPVLSPPSWVNDPEKLKPFETGPNASMLVPDPSDYAQWFDAAGERARRLAVGTRKYSAVADALRATGEQPRWEHFIDRKGNPLSLKRIQDETPIQRAERVAKVRSVISQRRQLIQQVSRYGFLKPESEKTLCAFDIAILDLAH